MERVKLDYQLSDFDFAFDEAQIATRPATPREAAGLLVYDGVDIHDTKVADFMHWLGAGDLLVVNNTKVIPARLRGVRRRETRSGSGEAKIEVTLAKDLGDGRWEAFLKPLRKVNIGERIDIADDFHARLVETSGIAVVELDSGARPLQEALALYGTMPLPPYIAQKRNVDKADDDDYQSNFAKNDGAVAAPTASLHFTTSLIESLTQNGVEFAEVTLHVGAGTFLPVKDEDLDAHIMHSEWGEVSEATAARINQHRQNGGRVIAVGTTALRILESAAQSGKLHPFQGATDIFIRPGFQFQVTDGLVTNFHLPKSTLLMLVAAFIGYDNMKTLYAHAIAKEYRFFSYGDANLLLPRREKNPKAEK